MTWLLASLVLVDLLVESVEVCVDVTDGFDAKHRSIGTGRCANQKKLHYLIFI
jgi:hypothetical protein